MSKAEKFIEEYTKNCSNPACMAYKEGKNYWEEINELNIRNYEREP